MCGGDYSLISEVVSPGFEYDDNEVACLADFELLFSKHIEKLSKFIKASGYF